ncbi:MAG: U32 family peptidase C-terminal domain-containing protein [Bdellovibrionota bacterium]
MNAPELLMPAGDPEKMRYAFAYGADAVYAGVPIFSLRARENGFRADSLGEAIRFAHSIGKKIYLTMNIYAHNSRIDAFLNSFCAMADLEPDGFIMSDVGLINQALRMRPNAIIHLSTQANATNWTAVQFWRDMGIRRVVLSRELSLKEIAEIHRRVPDIELEAFVHGSICIAYSGRCLISNYLSHRDANEGTCTNSCRWEYSLGVKGNGLRDTEIDKLPNDNAPYEPLKNEYYVTEQNRLEQQFELDEDEHGTYMMNSKDLCAIELLQELVDAGVVSFKVEGRSKGLYYVAAISRAYRRAIDDLVAKRPFSSDNLREAISPSNRTLMTGFLLRRPQEYGQNYTDGASRALTHRYAGQVIEYRPSERKALVLLKNPVATGDALEWMTPTDTIHATVEECFEREDGSPVRRAHGGEKVWLRCPDNISDVSLIRSPMPEEAVTSEPARTGTESVAL